MEQAIEFLVQPL